MTERTDVVTFKGGAITLVGEEIEVGEAAPDFSVLANDLSEVTLGSLRGKTVIISAVPSLDTPVCDTQTRWFNQEAGSLGENIVVLTVSMDLPFAQKRWCGAAGIEHVQTVSDHRDASFATAYGLLIEELRLISRAVLIVDREGVLRYAEVVKEVTNEPDYEACLKALREIA
jgi:thiol peroxidase